MKQYLKEIENEISRQLKDLKIWETKRKNRKKLKIEFYPPKNVFIYILNKFQIKGNSH